jgi:putative ABC transport system ATP-binding protein
VLQAIEQTHAELGTATILITHNAVIADMADRVLVMGDGRIQSQRRNTARRAARELTW